MITVPYAELTHWVSAPHRKTAPCQPIFAGCDSSQTAGNSVKLDQEPTSVTLLRPPALRPPSHEPGHSQQQHLEPLGSAQTPFLRIPLTRPEDDQSRGAMQGTRTRWAMVDRGGDNCEGLSSGCRKGPGRKSTLWKAPLTTQSVVTVTGNLQGAI